MRDEQALTDRFEALCGSIERAQRLFRIWKNSYPNGEPLFRGHQTKKQVFERRAADEGYTPSQIRAFYDCQ